MVGKGKISKISSNSVSDGVEDANGASGSEEHDLFDKTTVNVLVIPFNPSLVESVGLLSEQKVSGYFSCLFQ